MPRTRSRPSPHSLLERLRYHGTATVGERGQVALPVELRRDLGLQGGEKLIVFRLDGDGGIALLRGADLARLLVGAPEATITAVFGRGGSAP